MQKIFLIFIVFLLSINAFSQVENLMEKYILPQSIEENSGILFFNNKLVIHNDSQNQANLYELDTITNQITRAIAITNATNSDWEDIAEDDNYIYIGDIGNNYGTRTDLKIYRINKSNFINSNTVNAEIINYSYEDQTSFVADAYTNFDAESMAIIGDNIHIFTKNRGNFETNHYTFSKTIGTHSATLISSYNIEGLATGATYDPSINSVLLSGYTQQLKPFIIILSDLDTTLKFNFVQKDDLYSTISYNQIEGITLINGNRYFLSSEKFTYNSTTIDPKLFTLNFNPAILNTSQFSKTSGKVYPNPVTDYLIFEGFLGNTFFIYDIYGKLIYQNNIKNNKFKWNRINQFGSSVSSGVYFVKSVSLNTTFTKKIILK